MGTGSASESGIFKACWSMSKRGFRSLKACSRRRRRRRRRHHFGAFGGHLGPFGGHLGTIFGTFGTFWDHFGGFWSPWDPPGGTPAFSSPYLLLFELKRAKIAPQRVPKCVKNLSFLEFFLSFFRMRVFCHVFEQKWSQNGAEMLQKLKKNHEILIIFWNSSECLLMRNIFLRKAEPLKMLDSTALFKVFYGLDVLEKRPK